METMSSGSGATLVSPAASSVVFSARRTEAYDVPNIVGYMNYATEALFGRINVIYLL